MKLVLTIDVPDEGPNAAALDEVIHQLGVNRRSGFGLSVVLPRGTFSNYTFDGVLKHIGVKAKPTRERQVSA